MAGPRAGLTMPANFLWGFVTINVPRVVTFPPSAQGLSKCLKLTLCFSLVSRRPSRAWALQAPCRSRTDCFGFLLFWTLCLYVSNTCRWNNELLWETPSHGTYSTCMHSDKLTTSCHPFQQKTKVPCAIADLPHEVQMVFNIDYTTDDSE